VKSVSPTKLAFLDDLLASGLPRLDWAVKHVVPLATTGFVVGGWGSGKTALLLDIALRIAHGISFAGRKVTKGAVIYCGLENSAEVERRIHAWRIEAGDSARDGAFALHRGPLSLYKPDGTPTKDERELIKHAKSVEQRYGVPVSLV
ncbi:AAA family ATPase, partial [Enterobacter cloacae complex sp.6722787]|uniref:AAA family ATPase n=1 Tax=Enterobacter cloacae complex sp.6722787 TaxID=3397174 RepID=UPI003AAB45A6